MLSLGYFSIPQVENILSYSVYPCNFVNLLSAVPVLPLPVIRCWCMNPGFLFSRIYYTYTNYHFFSTSSHSAVYFRTRLHRKYQGIREAINHLKKIWSHLMNIGFSNVDFRGSFPQFLGNELFYTDDCFIQAIKKAFLLVFKELKIDITILILAVSYLMFYFSILHHQSC